MGAAFLSAANQGKNNWWRYGLGILLTAFFWIILGSIPLMTWGLFNPEAILSIPTEPSAQVGQYAVVSLSFVFFLIGLYITVTQIHQRRFLTLIQANGIVRLGRMLEGAGVWITLMGFSYAIEALFFPSHFVLTFHPAWFILVPIALLLTPIQSGTEELFFRGYLLQGLGLLTRNRWLLITVTSFIFAVLHFGNPEVAASSSFIWIALHYFAFGAFFALTTLKDNTLELAIGSHIANNFFLGTVISPNVSVLNTPALIRHTVSADAQIDFFLFLLQATLFYVIVFYFSPNKTRNSQQLP